MEYQASDSELQLFSQYQRLCGERDKTYQKTAPLEKLLDEQVAIMEAARVKAAEISAQIDEHLDQQHFARKKEIAFLARALSRPGGLLATKE